MCVRMSLQKSHNVSSRYLSNNIKYYIVNTTNRGGHGGFDDIFSHFGFNFGGHGGGRQQREQSTPNVNIPLRVSLKQLYLGDTIEVEYVRQTLCVNWQECMKVNQECQGPGVKVRMQQIAPGFVQQVQQRDERCVARGKMWSSNCRVCPEGQTQSEKIDLTIDLQKGMYNGEPITFEGVADEMPGVSYHCLFFACCLTFSCFSLFNKVSNKIANPNLFLPSDIDESW
jgi:DnaJ-class molecular chaperone